MDGPRTVPRRRDTLEASVGVRGGTPWVQRGGAWLLGGGSGREETGSRSVPLRPAPPGGGAERCPGEGPAEGSAWAPGSQGPPREGALQGSLGAAGRGRRPGRPALAAPARVSALMELVSWARTLPVSSD